jgi:hypothetical protein
MPSTKREMPITTAVSNAAGKMLARWRVSMIARPSVTTVAAATWPLGLCTFSGPKSGEHARNISLTVKGGKESGPDDDESDGSAPPPALHGKRDGGSEHQWQDDGLVGKVSQISHARPYRLRVLKTVQKRVGVLMKYSKKTDLEMKFRRVLGEFYSPYQTGARLFKKASMPSLKSRLV